MAIPEGWTQRTIGELAVLRRGLTWRKDQECESLVSDSLPVLRIPNVQQRLVLDDVLRVRGVTQTDRERYRVSVGSSLLVGSNGNPQRVGNCVFIDHGTEFLFASFLIAASVANTNIEPGYLFRILASRSVQDSISEAVQGSTGLKNINLTGLREIPVNLPPLPEQKKIAAILSSVDEVIAKTEAVIAQLQIVKKAMMEQLLTKGMPDRHTRFKQTEIGEIPEEWEVVSLERAASRIVVGVVIQPASYYVPDGIPALRSLNVKDDEILLDKLVFFSDASNQQLSKSQIRTGDVLTVRTGVPGVSACVPAALNGANCIDLIITTPSAALRGEFLSRFINSDRGRGAILKRQGGLAQQHFNVGEMKQLLVPIPSIEEQDLIIERLQVIDVRLGVERALAKAITIVKAALSSSLLSGELRVIPEVAE